MAVWHNLNLLMMKNLKNKSLLSLVSLFLITQNLKAQSYYSNTRADKYDYQNVMGAPIDTTLIGLVLAIVFYILFRITAENNSGLSMIFIALAVICAIPAMMWIGVIIWTIIPIGIGIMVLMGIIALIYNAITKN